MTTDWPYPQFLKYWVYWAGYWLFRFLLRTAWPTRVFGQENVPPGGPLIIAANHTTYLDPPLVGTIITKAARCRRLLRFMAKEELFAGFSGWLMRHMATFQVRRGQVDRQALKKAEEILRLGGMVGMFPEGTRSRNRQLQKAESGIGLLVLRTGAPVVPMVITDLRRQFLPHGLFPKPQSLRVVIGPTLQFCLESNLSRREAVELIASQVMQAIAKL